MERADLISGMVIGAALDQFFLHLMAIEEKMKIKHDCIAIIHLC